MGNACTPVADSCQCMAKPIQYCKVKKKKNKTEEKKTAYVVLFWEMLFYLYEDFLPSVSSVLYFGKHSRLILCFSYLLYCFLFLLYTQFYLRREMFTT